MPAIKPHKTETSNKAWDGPANEARLKSGENEAYYHKAYAWQDPDGDPKQKQPTNLYIMKLMQTAILERPISWPVVLE